MGNKRLVSDIERTDDFRCVQEEKSWHSYSSAISAIMSARMKELGMTQKKLAEKMGCTQQYISKIIKGKENLSLEAIGKIENALDVQFFHTGDKEDVPKGNNE